MHAWENKMIEIQGIGSGNSKEDFLKILNEEGSQGWEPWYQEVYGNAEYMVRVFFRRPLSCQTPKEKPLCKPA